MDNSLSAAGGNRNRQRGIWVMMVCAVLITGAAAVWVTRGKPPRQAPPPAAAVVPTPQSGQAPAGAPPTADEEGGRTVFLSPAAPVRNLLEQPRRQSQAGAAEARPHRPPEPPLSARHQTARPLGPVRKPDQTPVAQSQATTGQPPIPGAAAGATSGRGSGAGGNEGTGDGAGSGSSVAPASGGDAGATGAAATVPEQLLPPQVITFAADEYPGEAFKITVERGELGPSLVYRGTAGNVRVRAFVRADGRLGAVEVAASSGSPIVDHAATEAVRRWVFAPATRNGVPLDAYVTFTIRYVVR